MVELLKFRIMGLDIIALLDNHEELNLKHGYEIDENNYLSRSFCNFICRRNVIEDSRPELDQIGVMTDLNINFLYDMCEYMMESDIDECLQFYNSEKEKAEQKRLILELNKKVENNIVDVENKLTLLIEKTESLQNLPQLLDKTNNDTIGREIYFSKMMGSSENPNLIFDLKRLLNTVRFGIKNGSKTVYFVFG